LLTVLESLFRDFKFELPSTSIRSFAVTRETLDKPAEAVRDLLRENSHAQHEVLKAEVVEFVRRFQRNHGYELSFEDDAVGALVEESLDRDKTIRGLCEEKFRDFHHGLKLISRNNETNKFTITRAVVTNPEKELSQWVIASFRSSDDSQREPAQSSEG
jgi:ATP-dependent protease Clp ATPase subunit